MAREFDWSLLEQPDPMAMVRGQLGFSWAQLRPRLLSVTGEEFAWAPGPGALGVIPRGTATGGRREFGAGDTVIEWPAAATGAELGEAGVSLRTISWLVAHLTEVFQERWEWTFGDKVLTRADLTYLADREAAVAQLVRWVDAWEDGIAALDPAEVMTVGRSQATPIDQAAPYGHLVLHLNRELVHHGAEICTLQDIYRATHP